jgi:hypothetical protein
MVAAHQLPNFIEENQRRKTSTPAHHHHSSQAQNTTITAAHFHCHNHSTQQLWILTE